MVEGHLQRIKKNHYQHSNSKIGNPYMAIYAKNVVHDVRHENSAAAHNVNVGETRRGNRTGRSISPHPAARPRTRPQKTRSFVEFTSTQAYGTTEELHQRMPSRQLFPIIGSSLKNSCMRIGPALPRAGYQLSSTVCSTASARTEAC